MDWGFLATAANAFASVALPDQSLATWRKSNASLVNNSRTNIANANLTQGLLMP